MKRVVYKKIFNLNFFLWLFFYIAIFFCALNISFSYLDFDMPWHLRIGQQIVSEKAVPTIDYYDHTLAGRHWVDHEWLFNVFFYYIYHHFGYFALNVFFAILITIFFILLKVFTQIFFINKYLYKNKPSTKNISPNQAMFLIMTLEAFALVALAPLIGIRMQIAGNILFLSLLFLLELFNQSLKKKYLFVLPFLFVLWANLHGSFLLGLAIIWSWLGFKIIEPFLGKYKFFNNFEFNPLKKKDLLFSFLIIFFSSLATLINPYGVNLYSFLSTYHNTYYLSSIVEWRPFYSLPILYKQLTIMAIFLAVFLLNFYSLKNKSEDGIRKYVPKLNLWFLFLSLLFFVLSLKSKRHFPLFLISSFALIIQFFYFELIKEIKIKFKKITTTFIKIGILFIFCGLSFYFFKTANINNNPFNPQAGYPLPYQLVNFLKSHPELTSKKILNDYTWGGYFLWALPKMKLFIDGRMPQIEYNHHSLMEEYTDFFEEEKVEKKISDHKIELVILQKDQVMHFNTIEQKFLGLDEEKINSQENYLQNFLTNNDNWSKIYEDDLSELYLLK